MLIYPNNPRNHCTQSLYPFSLGFWSKKYRFLWSWYKASMCNQPPICQNHPTVRYIEYHTRCPPDACYFEFLMHSVWQSTVISLVMYIPLKNSKNSSSETQGLDFLLPPLSAPGSTKTQKTKTKTKFPVYNKHLQLLESCFQVNESMRLSVAPNDEIPLNVLEIQFRLSKFIL